MEPALLRPADAPLSGDGLHRHLPPPKHQVKIIRFLGLLEEMGPTLPRPYADVLRDGIHELRIKLSGDQIRLLYFFCYQKYIVLYFAFVKNTDRVPDKFISKVTAYREAFLDRVDPKQLEEMIHEEFRQDHVFGIKFQTDPLIDFDYCIDDIYLIPK